MRLRRPGTPIVTLISTIAVGLTACSSDSGGSATTTTAEFATVPNSSFNDGASSTLGTIPQQAVVGTVLEVAAANPDLSTFRAVVTAAGWDPVLSNPGPYTVFAPTNDAFKSALERLGITDEQLLADTELAKEILTHHILAGKLPSNAVYSMNAQQLPTMNGAALGVSIDDGVLRIDDAGVVTFDVPATNGIVHIIDQVLMPPTDQPDGDAATTAVASPTTVIAPTATPAFVGNDDSRRGNLIEVAHWNDDLSMFVQATGSADLFVTLANDGPFTLFVPTNDAFTTALQQLGMTADEFLADTELVTRILTYHVVTGAHPLAELGSFESTGLPTMSGAALPVTVNGDVARVADANIIAADLMANNGVIHVIDTVLIPS